MNCVSASSSCDSSCATCSGPLATECLTCPGGTYLFSGNNSCLACNVDGYSHPDGVNCIQCETSCNTCDGPLATDCLTCPPSTYLFSGNSTCLACNVDGYSHPNGVNCIQCEAACKTCSGPLATDCLTCLTGLYFFSGNNTCLACSVDGYSHPNGVDCIQCEASCKTCSGPLATDCLTCPPSTYLFSGNNTCLSCNIAGYSHPDGINCIQCDASCETCSGTLATDCLTCPSGTYFFAGNTSCVACTDPGYEHTDGISCVAIACDASCATCTGPSATDCLTCPGGTYLFSGNNTCLACNVAGFSQNGANCIECDSACESCSGTLATNCLTCYASTYLFSGNNTCLACNVDGYSHPNGVNCIQCEASCKTCSGPLATDCLTCPPSTYLFSGNNTCLSCNIAGYSHPDGINCIQCDASCETCSGILATDCLTCPSGTYFFAGNNSCVACTEPGYAHTDGINCVSTTCDASCATCIGPLPTDCLTCSASTYLFSGNNTCLACSVAGYSHPDGVNCIQCDSSCDTCSGTLATDCLTCPPGTYFFAGNTSCVACTDPNYSHTDGINCLFTACDPSCATCTGPSVTDCLTCTGGTYFFAGNNSCLACNVAGFSQNGANCIECDSSCESCSGTLATDCLTCYTSTYFFSGNNTCLSCNVAGYEHSDGVNCNPCDSSCASCTGPLATDCTTCSAGKYFFSSNTTCLACNVAGYSHPDGVNCITCDATCKTCSGSSLTSCVACYPGFYIYAGNHTCLSCEETGYTHSDGINCFDCHSSCKECDGPTKTDCTECFSGSYLNTIDGTCSSCIMDGFFIQGGFCKQCDPTCKTCDGPERTDCLSCYPSHYYNSTNQTCIVKSKSSLYPPTQASTIASLSLQTQSAAASILPMIVKGASTTAILLSDFVGDTLMYRYINVVWPENFFAFCYTLYYNFLPNPYQDLYTPDSQIGKFKDFEMSVYLLANSGNTLDRELYAIVVILLTWPLSMMLKKYPRVQKPLITIRDTFTWGTLMTFLMGDFTELWLHSMLQFREFEYTGPYSGFCYALGIMVFIGYPLTYVYFVYLLNRKKKPTANAGSSNAIPTSETLADDENEPGKPKVEWEEVPTRWNFISADLKRENWYARNFILVSQGVNAIMCCILFFLQDHGLIQASLYFAVNLIYTILTLFVYKPFESVFQTRIFALNFGVKLLMAGFAVALGAGGEVTANETVGLAMVSICIGTIFANAILSVWAIFKTAIGNCKKVRVKRKIMKEKAKIMPLRVKTLNAKSDVESAATAMNAPHKLNSPTIMINESSASNFFDSEKNLDARLPRGGIDLNQVDSERSHFRNNAHGGTPKSRLLGPSLGNISIDDEGMSRSQNASTNLFFPKKGSSFRRELEEVDMSNTQSSGVIQSSALLAERIKIRSPNNFRAIHKSSLEGFDQSYN